MNKLLLTLFGVFLLLTVNLSLIAQPLESVIVPVDPPAEAYLPEGLNYQAIARDADGNIMSETRIGVRIELLKGEAGDEVEYRELHHVRTDAGGQFSLVIGHGQKEVGEFKAIKWEDGNKWLQLSADIDETGDYELMGKSQMLSVPYAMYAGSAGGIKGDGLRNGNADDWDDATSSGDIYNNNTGNVGIGTNDPEYELHLSSSTAFPMNVEGSSGNAKFIAFSEGSSKLGWFGPTASNIFKVKNVSNSYMNFETKGAFNFVVLNDVNYPDMRAINFAFNNGWKDGNVRFYNERVYSGNNNIYDPSLDKVKVGIALHRTEDAEERLDVRGGIKIDEAMSQTPVNGGHIQYFQKDIKAWILNPLTTQYEWMSLSRDEDFDTSNEVINNIQINTMGPDKFLEIIEGGALSQININEFYQSVSGSGDITVTDPNNDGNYVVSYSGSGSNSQVVTTITDNNDGTFTYTNEDSISVTFDANTDDADSDPSNEMINNIQLVTMGPDKIIEIDENGSINQLNVNQFYQTVTGAGDINVADPNNDGNYIVSYTGSGGQGGGSSLWTNPTGQNPTDIITQDQQANVGIGTGAPDEKLHVDGDVKIKDSFQESSYLMIENDDALVSSGQNPNSASIQLINDDPNSNESKSVFELSNVKYDDGTLDPNAIEAPQDEFKIRRNINHFGNGDPMAPPSPPIYRDYITLEGDDGQVGIMTSNPHATLSVKGNAAIGNNYAVYTPPNESDIDSNTLIVEGKIGVGTMTPASFLDIAGATTIGQSYAGTNTVTSPVNGLLVEGPVGIGTSNPNTNYKLNVNQDEADKFGANIISNSGSGNALKIGNLQNQTSGSLVSINGANNQKALSVEAGNTNLNGTLFVKDKISIGQEDNSNTSLIITGNNSHIKLIDSSVINEAVTIGYDGALHNLNIAFNNDTNLSLTKTGLLYLSEGVGIKEISNDETLADESPISVPTEYAVRNYIKEVTNNGFVEVCDIYDSRYDNLLSLSGQWTASNVDAYSSICNTSASIDPVYGVESYSFYDGQNSYVISPEYMIRECETALIEFSYLSFSEITCFDNNHYVSTDYNSSTSNITDWGIMIQYKFSNGNWENLNEDSFGNPNITWSGAQGGFGNYSSGISLGGVNDSTIQFKIKLQGAAAKNGYFIDNIRVLATMDGGVTANGTINNSALWTGESQNIVSKSNFSVKIGDLATGSGNEDKMVFADSLGKLKTAIPSLENLNDATYGAFDSTNNSKNNLFVGLSSGVNQISGGSYNTAVGILSQNSLTIGDNNTALGYEALKLSANSNNNTSVGLSAMRGSLDSTHLESNDNIAIGFESLREIFSGDQNVAIGSQALQNTGSGIGNTGSGYQSLYNNKDGNYNVAIGFQAGFGKDTNSWGHDILEVGDSNVFIGYQAGYEENGSNKLYISNSKDNNLITGDFATKDLTLDAKTFIKEQASINYPIFPSSSNALTVKGGVVIGKDLNNSHVSENAPDGGLIVQGDVHIGDIYNNTVPKGRLHVVDNKTGSSASLDGHIAIFENRNSTLIDSDSTGNSVNGIAINLRMGANTYTNRHNNYLTFFDCGVSAGAVQGQTVYDLFNYDSDYQMNYDQFAMTMQINSASSFLQTIMSGLSVVTLGISSAAGSLINQATTATLDAYLFHVYEQTRWDNVGVCYKSGSADYAEYLERQFPSEPLKPGFIVGVTGGKISANTKNSSELLVVSTNPGVLGNMPTKDKEHLYEKVAFLGQVPVFVRGGTKVGDFILPSGKNDGVGIAVSPDNLSIEQIKNIVGVAWSAKPYSNKVSTINLSIGVGKKELAILSAILDKKLSTHDNRLAKIEAQLGINSFGEHDLTVTYDSDVNDDIGTPIKLKDNEELPESLDYELRDKIRVNLINALNEAKSSKYKDEMMEYINDDNNWDNLINEVNDRYVADQSGFMEYYSNHQF